MLLLFFFHGGLSQIRHHIAIVYSLPLSCKVSFFSVRLLLPGPYHGTPIDCSVTCNILINYPHGSALNSYNPVHLISRY